MQLRVVYASVSMCQFSAYNKSLTVFIYDISVLQIIQFYIIKAKCTIKTCDIYNLCDIYFCLTWQIDFCQIDFSKSDFCLTWQTLYDLNML